MHWGPKEFYPSVQIVKESAVKPGYFLFAHHNPETTLLTVLSGTSRFNKVHEVARLNDFIPVQVSRLGQRRSRESTLCGRHDTEDPGNFTAGKSSHLVLDVDPPLQSQETTLILIFFSLSMQTNIKH